MATQGSFDGHATYINHIFGSRRLVNVLDERRGKVWTRYARVAQRYSCSSMHIMSVYGSAASAASDSTTWGMLSLAARSSPVGSCCSRQDNIACHML